MLTLIERFLISSVESRVGNSSKKWKRVEVLVHPFCLVIHPLSISYIPPLIRLALACLTNQIFVFSAK